MNAGWIGGPCEADRDCDYDEGYCLQAAEGYPRGQCSLDCDRFCPDRDGMPVTFCVDDVVEGSGACIQRCDMDAFPEGGGCRPGYHCAARPRYNEADVSRGVCVPGAPPEPDPGDLGCFARLDRAGLNYERAVNNRDSPAGRPDLTCDVEGALRLSSPVGGIDYVYVAHDDPRPMYMACELAAALADLAVLLRARDVVSVGHIGTYNCRVIGGTNSISMHGYALAIDLKWFRTSDGRVYDVEDHWEHDTQNFRTEEGRWLFELGQEMFRRNVFNIVLTPNYDAAHDNHFHVDLTPGASFIGAPGEHLCGGRHFGPNPHGD